MILIKKILLSIQFRFITFLSFIAIVAYHFDWNNLNYISPQIAIYFIISTVVMLISNIFLSLRWKILLDSQTGISARFSQLYCFYLIGGFFSILLPSSVGGDVSRAYNSKSNHGLNLKRATSIIFSERLFGLTSLGLIFCFGLILDTKFQESLDFKYWTYLILAVGIILLLYLANKFSSFIKTIPISLIILVIIFSTIVQLSDILVVKLFSIYFEQNIPFSSLLLVMPVVYISTILPVSISGIGVREGVMVGLLSIIGIDPSISILLAVLLFLTKVITALFGGVIYFFDGNKLILGDKS